MGRAIAKSCCSRSDSSKPKRGPRCRQAVIVTKQLLAGETVHYYSSYFVADGVRLLIPPRPNVPVYLAGRGASILRGAGEVADGVIIGGLVTPAGLTYALDMVRRGAEAKGRDWKQLDVISWFSCHLTDNRAATARNLRANVAHIIGGAPAEVLETIGLEPGRIAEIKQVYAQGGPEGAAPLLTLEEIDLLAMVGTPDECALRMRTLVDAGVKQIGILLSQSTVAEQEDFLLRFAAQVIPQLR
jgi:5,10-methylenetetrahydromethanopterin reductase